MDETRKRYLGLEADQRFLYTDAGDTLLVEDAELGLCKVDLTKPFREQFLEPLHPHA
jgi:hypothetical protein